MAERHTEDPGARLDDAKDRQLGFRWPVVLDQRLDDLVERAHDFGERTNRRELLAALLLAADHDGDELGRLLRTYRTARVRDALLDSEQVGADVLTFAKHRPGPRTRRS